MEISNIPDLAVARAMRAGRQNQPAPSLTSAAENERLIGMVTYDGKSHTSPRTTGRRPWKVLAPCFTKRAIRETKDGRGYSCVNLKPGGTRSNANVESVTALVIDSDQGVSYDDIRTRLAGHAAAIHTTHSHTSASPCVRAIVPLNADVPVADWAAFWAGAKDRFGADIFDPSTKDPARFYYLPSCPPLAALDSQEDILDGALLDPEPLIARGRALLSPTPQVSLQGGDPDDLGGGLGNKPETPYPFDDNREAFIEALVKAYPCPDSRETWSVGERALAYLVASHGWPESEAKQILDEWSARAVDADKSNNDKDWQDVLARTKRRLDSNEGAVTTHLTVLKLAREAGWAPKGEESQNTATPGDILNARLFAGIYKNKLLYVYSADKWLRWDAERWIACNAGEEIRAAKFAAGAILDHCAKKAKELGDDAPRAKRLVANALRAQKEQGLVSMLRLAQSEPGMQVSSNADLDVDPLQIGVRNGVIDLRSGALLAPNPVMRITRLCDADYDRTATAPRWETFQREIAGGDADMVRYKQMALGYCITGLVDEEKLFFAYGHGANGKSVEANVLRAILGDYVSTAPASMFAVKRDGDGPRNDVARLAGARLVLANETQSGDRLDEQLVKTLVSREKITARFLHREFFEFEPTFKILMRGNHKPIVTGDDLGIWRRIDLWPYERSFEGPEADPDLESKLLAERDGILAWLVEGCLLWQKHRLAAPKAVRTASAAYRAECDVLGDFLATECTQGSGLFIGQPALYGAYKAWCIANSYRPMAKGQFTRKVSERGISESRRTVGKDRVRTYEGVCPNDTVGPLLASLARK